MTIPAIGIRIDGDETAAIAAMDAVRARAKALAKQVETTSTSFGGLGRMSRETSFRLSQVGMQVQDIAVQLAGGTKWTTVFAQQGSQIASMWGPVGAVVGAVAAVTLPLLGAALASTEEKTQSLDKSVDAMSATLSRLKEVSATYTVDGIQAMIDRYGVLDQKILLLQERMRQLAVDDAMSTALKTAAEFKTQLKEAFDYAENGGTRQGAAALSEQLGVSADKARELKAAIDAIAKERTFEGQADAIAKVLALMDQTSAKGGELYQALVRAEDVTRAMNAEGAKTAGWLGAAVSGAQSLASKLWEAATAAAKVRSEQAQAQGAYNADGGVDAAQRFGQSLLSPSFGLKSTWTAPNLPKSGGGGAAKKAVDDQKSMMDKLVDATKKGLGDQLTAWGDYFQNLGSLTQSGSSRVLAVSKAFAAASALMDAWGAYNKALNSPTPMPWWARLAAAASVFAAGLGAVNAIRGITMGGGGRGGRGSSSGGSAAAPSASSAGSQGPLDVYLGGKGGAAFMALADALLGPLMKVAGERGIRFATPR